MRRRGLKWGVKAVGVDAVCAVSADFAFQTWACRHTSRHSWQVDSPWGTAAARGTRASAAPRTQVSLRAGASRVYLTRCGHWWTRISCAGWKDRGGGWGPEAGLPIVPRSSAEPPCLSFLLYKAGASPPACAGWEAAELGSLVSFF